MWNVTPSTRWNWEELRAEIREYGVRNSLLLAPMPTASTAQILGNNESFEPYTSNIYTRRVLSGDFQVVNQHLLKDLSDRGLWNDDLKNEIISQNGSIQKIDTIPDDLKKLYRTVWEIPQKNLINMAADRGAFIDQSQSLNIHLAEPTFGKMSSMHFYAWKKGLKTGLYYLRTRPAADPIKFTVDKTKLKYTNKSEQNSVLAGKSINNKEEQGKQVNTTTPTKKNLLNGKTGSPAKGAVLKTSTTSNESDEALNSNADLIEQLKMACSIKNKEKDRKSVV